MDLQWSKWVRSLLYSDDEPKLAPKTDLPTMVEQARRDWIYALEFYNQVADQDMVDYAAYLIKASETKYLYLLRKARREGVVHCIYGPFN